MRKTLPSREMADSSCHSLELPGIDSLGSATASLPSGIVIHGMACLHHPPVANQQLQDLLD